MALRLVAKRSVQRGTLPLNRGGSIRCLSTSSSLSASQPSPSPYPAGRDRHVVPPPANVLKSGRGYEHVCENFVWPHEAAKIEEYNIGVDICDKWAKSERKDSPALIFEDTENDRELVTCSFAESFRLSNLLGHTMQKRLGVTPGDRVAILMSQSIETALVHMSTYKVGGIAVPLFVLFGPEALEYRLADAGAKVVFVEPSKLDEVVALKAGGNLPELEHIVVSPPLSAMRFQDVATQIESDASSNPARTIQAESNGATPGKPAQVHHLASLLAATPSSAVTSFTPVRTTINDPAIIIYTSGTTGPPKGALHAHRVLLGHLPGVEFPHEFFPQHGGGGDLFWTPADWAWIGGLIDVLLPSLHHGVAVYACRFRKFDPELAFDCIERRGIRNMFMPPTALKLMRTVQAPEKRYPKMRVRTIGSGGESLGDSLLEWGRTTFNGMTINEFYGQTECNLVLGNCSQLFPTRPGSMGKPVSGHIVRVVDDEGNVLPEGQVGNIGVHAPDPVMMLRYWNKPQATKDKYTSNGYLLTGDLAKVDSDGYFHFFGRSDDVIKSSGYRIGPAEIEDCLMKHSAVSNVAAIGLPDALRGEIVKVCIVLRPDAYSQLSHIGDESAIESHLRESIAQHVKGKLAAYEYPREIEFVQSLPMTTTGKVMRKELKKQQVAKMKQQQGK